MIAVGGAEGGSVTDVSSNTGETAWYEGGGGFSWYADRPVWQSDAVADYLELVEDDLPERYKVKNHNTNVRGLKYTFGNPWLLERKHKFFSTKK